LWLGSSNWLFHEFFLYDCGRDFGDVLRVGENNPDRTVAKPELDCALERFGADCARVGMKCTSKLRQRHAARLTERLDPNEPSRVDTDADGDAFESGKVELLHNDHLR
jgi:hypothetical protein